MRDQMRKDLSSHRLSRAKEFIEEAEILFTAKSYKGANNRAYYSIFYAMRAVLALSGEDFKRHSGVIQYFQKNYIKTGIFEKKCFDIITTASRIRNASDYDDFYIASRDESEQQIKDAKALLDAVRDYLITQSGDTSGNSK